MALKKTLASLLLATDLFVSGCSNQIYQENILKSIQNSKKFSELQFDKKLRTIKGIQDFLFKEIIYVPEKKEKWNSPKKTIELGYGDCDDIAILGSYLAEFLGYPAKILFLVDPINGGHSLTLLEERTNKVMYGAIQHTDLFYPVYSSIEELVEDINKIDNMNYFYYLILDLDSLDKNWRMSEKDLTHSKDKRIYNLVPIKQIKEDKHARIKGYKVGRSIIFLK